jgi:hypothetical protein
MAERMYFPNSPACGQWETLLADALDGLLKPEDEASFSAHMAQCPACTALFDEARRGREWLEFLSPEPEVPAGLLDKILAQTGPGQQAGFGLASGPETALPVPPAWQKPGFMGTLRRFAEPRLMMTAAMAFFSITLTLNLTGVRLTQLKASDLRPTAMRSYLERRITTASTPIVRYYDHLRFVYEVQTRVRELRRSTGGGDTTPQPQSAPGAPGQSKTPKKDGGSRILPFGALPGSGERSDFLETSLRMQTGHAHLGGSTEEPLERSTPWTA